MAESKTSAKAPEAKPATAKPAAAKNISATKSATKPKTGLVVKSEKKASSAKPAGKTATAVLIGKPKFFFKAREFTKLEPSARMKAIHARHNKHNNKDASAGKKLKLVQYRSQARRPEIQAQMLHGLGLAGIGHRSEVLDTPSLRATLRKLNHLVKIEA